MNNKEYFGNKTLNEALAKYTDDTNKGLDSTFRDWLVAPYVDLSKGKIVRGMYFSYDRIEEKIRKMESVTVTGYLLEFKDEKTGEWVGSEFAPEKGADSNLWLNDALKDAADDWYYHDTQKGFFKALEKVWFQDSDDWDFRLGVAFDRRFTPTSDPKDDGIWEGITEGGCGTNGEPWRVRKATVKGELSDTAKEFFRRNPDIWLKYAD
jgi:hypothetical protein